MECVTSFKRFTGILSALSTCGALAVTTVFATGAGADTQTESYVEDASGPQRINSSGRLRMLSQRVAASACYVQAGIETDATTAMLNGATEEFQQIVAALEFGDADLGIYGEETDIKTLRTIEEMHSIWDPISAIVDNVIAGTATPEDMTQLALESQPLLEMAQNLVTVVTAEHSLNATLSMRDALAIDLAGRQRMLSQRISKDVCLLGTGIDANHALEDLAQTAEVFDASLTALRGGMPDAGLEAPTDEQVIADLDQAAADWAIVQTKIADALSGQPINEARLAEMFELANTLTADMNKVVVDYTEALAREQ